MAVYTQVSDQALAAFLAGYALGLPVAFKGIAEGVENSNYYLETTTGRYILTLFEKRVATEDLPYFIALKRHLSGAGFPCPEPIENKHGEALGTLAGRPALIISFLDGLSIKDPKAAHCFEVGAGLARMHAALSDFAPARPNTLGPADWPRLWQGRSDEAEALQNGLAAKISADLDAINAAKPQSLILPRGTIHADLFPDNAFFMDGALSGIIDFYFACTDALAYDLAICLNAWAFSPAGTYDAERGAALIAGYQSQRRLSSAELDALPLLARGAALRFFLTRLIDWSDTPDDALVKPKNPLDYAARLAFHRQAETARDYGVI